MRRRRVLEAGAAVVLAGCVSYPGRDADETGEPEETDRPTADRLVREAIDARRRTTDLAARRVVTIDASEETVARTERVAERPPAEQRIEVVDSSDPSHPEGAVSVTNRTVTWEYDPDANVVEKQYHPNKVDTDRTRLVLETFLEEYRLAYEGTESVDGREAHVVEARPPSDEAGPTIELLVGDSVYAVPLDPTTDLEELTISRTILIDDEYRYPIAERNVVRDGDDDLLHRLTVAYEDLAIDEGLPAGAFTYEPPADAEVATEGTEPEGVFDSPDEAADAVPYDLPDPDVPDPYVLDRVTVVERSPELGTTATLWYVDPDVTGRELLVAVRETQRFDPDSSALEELEVDGITAYHQDGRLETVFWTCDGPDVSYRVASPAVDDPEPLLELAGSIGCS